MFIAELLLLQKEPESATICGSYFLNYFYTREKRKEIDSHNLNALAHGDLFHRLGILAGYSWALN